MQSGIEATAGEAAGGLREVRRDELEIFGPVAAVRLLGAGEQAIRLACPFFTFRVSQGLRDGQVGIDAGAISTEVPPSAG
ncbi:hypothetical protein [Ancylobacter mangrovi]|uniref:hypothetical protein n=1 Tax=Ancylobacter mangrovi TaxID=2972472 RepID=UPI002162971A|nr:hypothetical protein [Ancylobacter mangrovi]MCS0504851.1 hypothetical protein [Ancylobacter mangrovi]